MQTRREFLKGATVAAIGGAGEGCSSSTSDTAGSCNGVSSTSSVNGGHTHTVCVPTTDLTNPPAAGTSYTTSLDAGHTHTVTLTQQQLQAINSGESVTVTSTGADPNHQFAIKKA